MNQQNGLNDLLENDKDGVRLVFQFIKNNENLVNNFIQIFQSYLHKKYDFELSKKITIQEVFQAHFVFID